MADAESEACQNKVPLDFISSYFGMVFFFFYVSGRELTQKSYNNINNLMFGIEMNLCIYFFNT